MISGILTPLKSPQHYRNITETFSVFFFFKKWEDDIFSTSCLGSSLGVGCVLLALLHAT